MEIVCNDWGVVFFLKREFPDVKLIVGRLLEKTIKEYRFRKDDYDMLLTKEGLRYLRSPSIQSAPSLEVIK